MKETKKLDVKTIVCSSIFNIVEISIIIIIGLIMKVKIEEIIILFLLFFLARITSYKPMHYKSPILCMIWSTLVFCSFFGLSKVNIFLAIGMTVFEAIILTGRGDIKDCFMFEKDENKKKYRELKEFVQDYKDTQILNKFENILKGFNNKFCDRYKVDLYEVYYLIFYKELSYSKVLKELELRNDNHIIINALDMVFICFNTFIELEELKKSEKDKELAKTG
jgi:hypothetical protein|nr:MAG TPA: accessory gene regulator B [Caudoviricetes sp.]